MSQRRFLTLALVLTAAVSTVSAEAVKVVTTLPDYASIAREIGGPRVDARAIVAGNADAHFIKPKPSYALMLRSADLFVSTGLDLELWAPVLVNKSGNRRIVDGAPGYVAASHGIDLLQKPASLSRTGGDIHIYGNPHIQTSPINAKIIARNITTGLCRIDPEGCEAYEKGLEKFTRRIDEQLYGKDLLELLDSNVLDPLAAKGRLITFLEEQGLTGKLGGWLGKTLPFRGEKIVCYHKNWAYFTTLFGLQVVDYVEPKPGIPPTARHVANLIKEIPAQHVKVLLAANYFEKRKPMMIAERTGIQAVIVPTSVEGEPEVKTYFDLMDTWIDRLAEAFGSGGKEAASR